MEMHNRNQSDLLPYEKLAILGIDREKADSLPMEVKEKLISSIHKGITIADIKGRDKSPFFRRIIHFFTFLYSVGVKEYILLNVLQK